VDLRAHLRTSRDRYMGYLQIFLGGIGPLGIVHLLGFTFTGLYVKGIYRLLENTGAYSVRTCVGLTILRRGI
jgi:hypothetical protein